MTHREVLSDGEIGGRNRGNRLVTDPPYHDNLEFADLSDRFYVWRRQVLRRPLPDRFSGITTPKDAEMIVSARAPSFWRSSKR